MKNVLIIDYGTGNLKSVHNAIKKVSEKQNCKVLVSSLVQDLRKATHIILPGVGAFESCLNGLIKTKIRSYLEEMVLGEKKPFLGICVGMQMLATKGFENGEFSGLNWISGDVKKINNQKNNLKIPHMGWNTLQFQKENAFTKRLLKKMKMTNLNDLSAYFVHSYNFKNKNADERVITTHYGEEITAMVSKENIIGTQFHPEKSHNFGLAFLETFLEED